MKNCFNKILLLTLLLYSPTPLLLYSQQEYSSIRHGNRDYNKENYTEAEVDYRRGLNINENSYEARFNLGNTLYREDKYQEAATEFAKAAENLDPKKDKERYAQTMHNLGNACFAQQQYDQAVAAYQESLRANPKDDDTRYNLVKAMSLLQHNQGQGQNQNQDQNQQQQQEQQQQQQDQQQQDNPQSTINNPQDQMDKETAEQILQALEQDEQETQEKLQRQQGKKRTVEKEW
ncbi:MAG: tetratricopeptide repeat protein [Paludibacteraceae bacterium]|nr:tetratricopeptide repeat protein [Paludibacteraceae bacterium]